MVKQISLVALLFIGFTANAQYIRDWVTSLPTPSGTINGLSSAADGSGNLYILQSENPLRDYMILTKYDEFGLIVWQRYVDRPGTENYGAAGITIGENDNIYMTAYEGGGGSRFIVLFKYDPNGNEIWSTVHLQTSALPRRIKYASDGYLYITGGSDVFLPPNQCLTLKYNAAGELIWSDLLDHEENNIGNDFIVDDSSNVYVSHGLGVIKYSHNGDEVWSSTTDLSGVGGHRIALDNEGNVIVAGNASYPQPRDIEVFKFDNSGNLLWSRSYDGSLGEDDSPTAITVDEGGNIYIVGISNSYISGTSVGAFIVLKYDSDGNIEFERILTGSTLTGGSHQGAEIMISPDGNLYASGCLYNTDTKADAFVCKMDTYGNILWQDNCNLPDNENETFRQMHFDENGNIYLVGISSEAQWSNHATAVMAKYCGNQCSSINHTSITGKVYNDLNENCVEEGEEEMLEGRMVSLSGSIQAHALTDTGGNFGFYVPPGEYSLNVSTNNYWVNTCDPGISVSLVSVGDSSYNNRIGAYLPPDIQDLYLSLVGGLLRPGYLTDYHINYTNIGTIENDGSIVFEFDSLMSFVSASPSPDSIFMNKLIWNYFNLNPNETRYIELTVQIDTNATLGWLLQPVFASIEPISSDLVPSNNTDSLHQLIIGPYDPNHKSIVPSGVLHDNDTLLTYTVQFQNMGTDTAFNVVVKDTISDWFDLSTFRLGATSHPATVQFVGNLMFVHFEGANLPPDTVNYLASQGFFKYTIQRKIDVPLGTDIKNTAHIYFDYAVPVATNTTHSYLGYMPEPEGIEELSNYIFVNVYPNPFTDDFTAEIILDKNASVELEIFDLTGRRVYQVNKALNAGKNLLELHVEDEGIFILRTFINGEVRYSKIISL